MKCIPLIVLLLLLYCFSIHVELIMNHVVHILCRIFNMNNIMKLLLPLYHCIWINAFAWLILISSQCVTVLATYTSTFTFTILVILFKSIATFFWWRMFDTLLIIFADASIPQWCQKMSSNCFTFYFTDINFYSFFSWCNKRIIANTHQIQYEGITLLRTAIIRRTCNRLKTYSYTPNQSGNYERRNYNNLLSQQYVIACSYNYTAQNLNWVAG